MISYLVIDFRKVQLLTVSSAKGTRQVLTFRLNNRTVNSSAAIQITSLTTVLCCVVMCGFGLGGIYVC